MERSSNKFKSHCHFVLKHSISSKMTAALRFVKEWFDKEDGTWIYACDPNSTDQSNEYRAKVTQKLRLRWQFFHFGQTSQSINKEYNSSVMRELFTRSVRIYGKTTFSFCSMTMRLYARNPLISCRIHHIRLTSYEWIVYSLDSFLFNFHLIWHRVFVGKIIINYHILY